MISQGTFGETQKEILSVLNSGESDNNLVRNIDEILVNKHIIQSLKKNVKSLKIYLKIISETDDLFFYLLMISGKQFSSTKYGVHASSA